MGIYKVEQEIKEFSTYTLLEIFGCELKRRIDKDKKELEELKKYEEKMQEIIKEGE